MCYVRRGKAHFEYSHFQCFTCEEFRISDQGIITKRAAQKCYALRVAPNMFEKSGVFYAHLKNCEK